MSKFSFLTIVFLAPLSAQAQDAAQWTGPYAGVAGAFGTGFQDYDGGGSNYDLEGHMLGVVLGYNMGSGPWVYGAELAISAGSIYEAQIGGSDTYKDYEFTNMVDLKARAGYSIGSALVYGTLGYSAATWSDSGPKSHSGGLLYGLGVDYLVSSQVFLGAEYVSRDAGISSEGFSADLDTVSLRVGMKF